MHRSLRNVLAVAAAAGLCLAGGAAFAAPALSAPVAAHHSSGGGTATPIKHVVVIFQENVSLDALNGTGVCGNGTPLGGHQVRCGYGQRLPLLVISPYAKANYVSGSLADQTSVLAFIEDNWLGGQRTGTSSFDNLAGSLDNMFSWDHPNFAPYLLNPVTGEPIH